MVPMKAKVLFILLGLMALVACAPAAGTTTIEVADITGFSELYLQATNNITLSSPLTMAAGNSIRLEANNNININAALAVPKS